MALTGKALEQEINRRVGYLHEFMRNILGRVALTRPTVVTIASMGDGLNDQWVLWDNTDDAALLAKRLRAAATLLESPVVKQAAQGIIKPH